MKIKLLDHGHIARVSAGAALLGLLLFHGGLERRASPQSWAVGYAGALPAAVSADELAQEFQLGKPWQREGLLRRLGVDSTLAHDANATEPETGIAVDSLQGTGGVTLLFLPCVGSLQAAHLFLLLPAARQRSRVSDHRSLDCWWQRATYRLLSISGDPQKAIFAQHVNYGHGSGYVQDDMWLFEVKDERLIPVLETQEYKSEQIAGTDEALEQESTLQPFPDGSIEETRATTRHVTTVKVGGSPDQMVAREYLDKIERRRWRRTAPFENFVPDDFVAVTP